jgi:Ca-activated chloride channel family protein
MSVRLVSRGGTEAADRLWARSKLHNLSNLMLDAPYSGKDTAGLVEQIIGTSLDYSILSEYTAFVAVDTYVRTDGSAPEIIGIPLNMPEGVSYTGIFGSTSQQMPMNGTMGRAISTAPSVSSGFSGGGGFAAGNMTAVCEELECDDSADYYYQPVYTASIGGISGYLGARPSEFRAVILEAVDTLNETPEILQPGLIRLELTVNGSGTITGVDVDEDTVEVDDIIEILIRILTGKTIPGASAGRVTVTINI